MASFSTAISATSAADLGVERHERHPAEGVQRFVAGARERSHRIRTEGVGESRVRRGLDQEVDPIIHADHLQWNGPTLGMDPDPQPVPDVHGTLGLEPDHP